MSCLTHANSRKSVLHSQIEQEMELIIGHDVKSSFITNWKSFVPAILQYGETCRKSSILVHMKDVDETGMHSSLSKWL